MSSQKYDYIFKLLLLGETNVGKTSIMNRFSEDYFTIQHLTTIGMDFKIKYIRLKEKIVKLQIWDTAGQKRFNTMTKTYYKGANCLILVYNIEDLNSFLNIKKIMNTIKENDAMDNYKVLVGNKCESFKRLITEEEGKKLADEYNMDFIEVSAKEDKNIFELFMFIINKLLKDKEENNIPKEKIISEKKKGCVK